MADHSQNLKLTTAVRTHGNTAALKRGEVAVRGATLDFKEVEPQILAFRQMVRDVAFDVCELAPTTYIIAKAYGAPFTAIPIFFERRFHHGGLLVRDDAGIREPKDLQGKKVGVRAYTVTTGVWTRGILVNEYGLDSSKVTWVVDDEEHVTQLQLPPNVQHVAPGNSLAAMMAAGEIQAGFAGNAGIGREGPPKAGWQAKERKETDSYRDLFDDPEALGAAWYRRTGIYPMHSTLVVKDEILKAHPWIAQSLFAAFNDSKNIYVDKLRQGAAGGKNDARYVEQMNVVGQDPLPYGLEVNRRSIGALILYAFQQGLIPRKMSVDDVFLKVDA
ncbi:MAG TPA: PhnD/SsuA/transferrin family substrate-binding protein [Steroidobacteraceae bacterium]